MKRMLPLAIVMILCVLVPALAESEAELKAKYETAVKFAAAAPQDYALNWQAAQAATCVSARAMSPAPNDRS